MQKSLVFLFSAFLVLGIVSMHAPFLMAEEGSDISNSGNDSDTVSTTSSTDVSTNSENSEVKIEIESEETSESEVREREENRIEIREAEENKLRERVRAETHSNGNKIEIERRIETTADGEIRIKIKRKIIDVNGSEIEQTLIIEKSEDGIKRILKVEGQEDVEVETELELDDEIEGNETNIGAMLSNGRRAEIKIMPNTASEVALERLRAMNFTVELKEVRERNEVRAVYSVEAEKQGRFLGVFKTRVKFESHVDPETGELLNVNKPWWAFLVAGEDSDQTLSEETSTETEGSTSIGYPAPGFEGVDEMIVVNETDSQQ